MTDKAIAETILKQLGGNQFRMMTGAKNFLAIENGLQFQLPYPKINRVKIELRPNDTYTVEFGRARKSKGELKYTPVSTSAGIYADALVPLFERETGLYTHL